MRWRIGAAVMSIAAFAATALAQGVDETWHVTGRIAATACAGSRCATRTQRLDESIVFTNGQISNIGKLGQLCDRALEIDATALGEYVPARRDWLRFQLTNRPLLRDVLRECLGNRTLSVTGFGSRVKPSADGTSFRERVHLSATLRVRGQQVNVTVGGRFLGERLAPGGARWSDAVSPLILGDLVTAALANR